MKLTLQQLVGLLTVVAVSVTGSLVAAEATTPIPTYVILIATVVSGALGAANVFLGSLNSMASTMANKLGPVMAHVLIDKQVKKTKL